MKLSIDTYVICGDMELEKLIGVAKSNDYVGIEFRAESGQKHGVEPETSKAQRQEVKRKMADAGINLRGLSAAVIGGRFIMYLALDTAEDAEKAMSLL